jgi:ABC-type multidrug transport system ATPase subunit/predicted component of type VI protein secretion system
MACQFTFLNGTRAGQTVRLEQRQFWLGRDPRCELSFDPQTDLTVSGRHLEITWTGQAYQLKDSSTNGTLLNGQPTKAATLKTGDVLELGAGGPQLRVEVVAGSAQPAPQPPQAHSQPMAHAPTVGAEAAPPRQPAVTPYRPPPQVGGPGPLPPTKPMPQKQALQPGAGAPPITSTTTRITITIERLPGGERQEFKQQVIRIGRDPTVELPFDPQRDLLVSYNHAKIMVMDGKAVLFDTESTNGTFIGGQRVSRQELDGGEEIELGLGGPHIRVHLQSEQVEVPAAAPGKPEIRGKATVFGGAGLQLRDLSLGDAAQLGEHPLADRMEIGRAEGNAIVLDSMYVSSRHAVIEKQNGSYRVVDAGSANGTYVDGERVKDSVLTPGTEFVVGPYVLKFSGQSVVVFDTRTKTWVDAVELTRTDPRTRRNFLDRVSLKIQPGEFVCILGPSGCGKSTLLKSLNGLNPADAGSVFMNNIDFYTNYEQLKHQVGYVPQDDIIHPQLSVWRTLHYAAKLRLPPDSGAERRQERIRDVLSALELFDHRRKPIHKLSGGQRKRVSIAVELLTDPAIIYLDEPTSGLDPHLEEKMMVLLREMTLRGKTVASVTHTLDNIHLADKVTFLVDGKLAFFGTSDEAQDFFKVERLPDVYKRFEEAKGNVDGLRTTYEESPFYEQHIKSQLSARQTQTGRPARKGKRIGPGALRQFWILTTRYAEIITRDLRNTAILLIQAPLVALFIVLAVRTDQPDRGPTSTMFLIMSLSALWFGCSNAAREITKEASIYARERMVNLKVIPYVASKLFVLQWLALVQVTTMLVIVYFLRSGYTLGEPPPTCARWNIQACSLLILDGVPGEFWLHLLNLYLTALTGIGLGLLVSALAGNSDKAMSLVPLVLIPQVLFSGSFGIPKADEHIKRGVGYAMTLNWSLDQAKRIAMCSPEEEKPEGSPGSGCVRCVHTYDPFKHMLLDQEDQDDDARCAAVLPVVGQMTEFPESLQVVEDGLYTPPSAHGKGRARDATKSYVGLFVLGGYTLLLFMLVCVVMRLKDRKQR